MVALAAILTANFSGVLSSRAATQEDEATKMMQSYEEEQRTAAAARGKDSAWKPSCKEVNLIQVGSPGALKNFCLNQDGNILACYAGNGKSSDPKNASGLRVYSPKGELLKTMALEIKPDAVCVAADGTIFAAGEGRLLKLDATGKVLASAESPVSKEKVVITKETEDMVKEMAKQTKRDFKDQLADMKISLEKRRADVTGLSVTDQDVSWPCPRRAILLIGSIALPTDWPSPSWSWTNCAAVAGRWISSRTRASSGYPITRGTRWNRTTATAKS